MSRPRPMKTMGPPGGDPPIEIVHFADPWCWWSWGLEPVLQRLREGYGDRLQVEYSMGGRCKDLDVWMTEYAVDEISAVERIRKPGAVINQPLVPEVVRNIGIQLT